MSTRGMSRPVAIVFTFVSLASLLAAVMSGCGPKLVQPVELRSPYPQRQVWAVVPFSNESGVSIVDTYRMADLCAAQAQQIYGIDTLPVNRVIAAMQQCDLPAITSASDAMMLMNVLNIDGLIVGTVTAYDPYPPPTLGIATELHIRSVHDRWSGLDPQTIVRDPHGEAAAGEVGPQNPVAQAAGVFDARNNQTLLWLNDFATGRTIPDSAYGKDIYLVNMELYTQFVCYRVLHDLLAIEQARLHPAATRTTKR
jgi:hypothetical protein